MTDADLPSARARSFLDPERWLVSNSVSAAWPHPTPNVPRPANAERRPTGAIDQALSQARALIDAALSEHRDGERSVLELPDDDEALALHTKKLLHSAEYELLCVATPEDLANALHPVAEALQAPAGPGPAPHVLLPMRDTDRRKIKALIPDAARHRVRLTGAPLQKMVLVDRRSAMVVSQFGPERRQALMVHNPAIIRTLHGLFTDSWGAAAQVRPVPMLDDPKQSETTRLVLAALRDGRKDDVAARELGISVRTYRRYVADFMRDIDATSRFQAGVRAAQLRLLPFD